MMESREGTVERLTVDGAREEYLSAAHELGESQDAWHGSAAQLKEMREAQAKESAASDHLRAAILDEQREAVDGLVKAAEETERDLAWFSFAGRSDSRLTLSDVSPTVEGALTRMRVALAKAAEAVGYTRNEDDHGTTDRRG